jgi:hypothetical protein
VRYIHLNLLKAGLVKNIFELNQSLWSGHSALMGKVKREWQNTEYVLSFFGQNRYRRRNYQQVLGTQVLGTQVLGTQVLGTPKVQSFRDESFRDAHNIITFIFEFSVI